MKTFLVLLFFGLSHYSALHASKRKHSSVKRCLALLHADKTNRAREVAGEEKWPVDGYDPYSLDNYNNFFADLLHPLRSFENFAEFKKRHSHSTHLLDLAGSGVFSNNPEVFDSITGFRSAPLSSDFMTGPSGMYKHREEFLGNAYAAADWKRLDKNMQQRSIPAFDIIIARPIGGTLPVRIAAIEMGPYSYAALNALFKRVIERAWARLASSGDLFIEIPGGIESQTAYRHWLQRLNSAGINVETQNGALHLHKYQHSEEELPD